MKLLYKKVPYESHFYAPLPPKLIFLGFSSFEGISFLFFIIYNHFFCFKFWRYILPTNICQTERHPMRLVSGTDDCFIKNFGGLFLSSAKGGLDFLKICCICIRRYVHKILSAAYTANHIKSHKENNER